jgi:hypothetical protein
MEPRRVNTFSQLTSWLIDHPAPVTTDTSYQEQAGVAFNEEIAEIARRKVDAIAARRRAHYLTLRSQAHRLLLQAAMVEIALGQMPGLWSDEAYPTSFDEVAVSGLQRHGYPWSALLALAFEPGLMPRPDDPYYQEIAGDKGESLKGRLAQLKGEASRMVGPLKAAHTATQDTTKPGAIPIRVVQV